MVGYGAVLVYAIEWYHLFPCNKMHVCNSSTLQCCRNQFLLSSLSLMRYKRCIQVYIEDVVLLFADGLHLRKVEVLHVLKAGNMEGIGL